jgi:ligand-binding SRPBCC domain-containing protein
MTLYTLHKKQFIQRPLLDVFSFFERPENLATITPSWLGFRLLTRSPVLMKKDAVIEHSVRVMGVRVRWKSLIREYEPPFRFVDVQLKGPYAFWHHTHVFTEVNGGTLISDEIQYAMPLGVIGKIVQRVAVKRQLDDIFAFRAEMIKRIFGGEEFLGGELSMSNSYLSGRSTQAGHQ